MLEYNEFYLTLVRHGQSTTNEQPDLMGQTADTPLSENGKGQAELLRKRLLKENVHIDRVWSSTYKRAWDTAEIALKDVSRDYAIAPIYSLREYDAGQWLGASRTETITLPVIAKMAGMGHGFLPPKGESLHQVERRASAWLEEDILYSKNIMEAAQTRKADDKDPLNLFVFSHGMTIKCLLHYIMGFDQSFTWKVTIENTSLTRLHYGPKGWRLLSINDHAHLNLL